MTLMIAVLKKKSLAMTLLATLLLVNRAALAQDQPPEDQEQSRSQWYQIEVFIFAYERPAQETETWPSDLGLKYPQRIISLQAASDDEAVLNNVLFDDQSGTGPQDPDQQIRVQQGTSQQSTDPTTVPAATAGDADAIAESNQLTPESIPTTGPQAALEEQPFTLLPEAELQLNAMADKLLRQGDIRKLFHAAWRQPIGPRDDSESILVRGGDPYDNHFELEGSINFGLERYLHISTDLWLSSFVSNVGGLQNPWPVLPPLPLASSLLSGDSMRLSFEEDDPLSGLTDADSSAANSFASQSTATNTLGLNFKALEFDNLFTDLAVQKYSVERTVTMRQQRRMRSSELHYLDHPLMGLLVKIIPYERPEPEAVDNELPAIDENGTGDLPQAKASLQ